MEVPNENIIMPNPLDRRRLKDRIVENISKAVKQIQQGHLYSTTAESAVLNNEDRRFQKLVEHLDHAFLHGLRRITDGYWVVVKSFTHSSVVRQVNMLTYVTTNLGRGRAWLYLALNEHLLESYLRCFSDNRALVSKHYVKESIVLDQQRLQLLLTLAAGLEHVEFELNVNVPYLDLSSHLRLRSVSEEDSTVHDAEDAVSLCSSDGSNYKPSSTCSGSMDVSSMPSSFVSSQQDCSMTNSMYIPRGPSELGSMPRSMSLPITDSTILPSRDSNTSLDLDFDEGHLEVIHVKPRGQKGKKKKGHKKRDTESQGKELTVSMVSPLPGTPESGYRSVVEPFSTSEVDAEGMVSFTTDMLPKTARCDRLLPQGEEERTVSVCQTGVSDSVRQVAATTRAQRGSPDGAPCFGETLGQQLTWSVQADEAAGVTVSDPSSTDAECAQNLPTVYASSAGGAETEDTTTDTHTDGACLEQSGDCSAAAAAGSCDCTGVHDNVIAADSSESTNSEVPIVSAETDNTESDITCQVVEEVAELVNSLEIQSDNTDGLNEEPSSEEKENRPDPVAKWIVYIDNNTKLVLMLDVFRDPEEKFIKMFQTSMGWTEGDPESVQILITSRGLYLMAPTVAEAGLKFHIRTHITYRELDYVSLSLGLQVINFVCANRRKQAWLTTGSQVLTRAIMCELDTSVRECELDLPRLSTLTDATTQKISLRKWAAKQTQMEPSEVSIFTYSLVYWQDGKSLKHGISPVSVTRQGMLHYCAYSSLFLGPVWKEGFFVLKNGVLYQYDDDSQSDAPPKLCIALNEECGGCRSTSIGRENSFEIIQGDGTALQLSAHTPKQAKEWITSLCRVVADGAQSNSTTGGCMSCCAIVTASHLLLCHEDLLTNFFRFLGKKNLTDMTGVLRDMSYPSYCVLDSSGQSSGQQADRWVLYFSTAAETDRFLTALDGAWSHHFKVSLPTQQVWDVELQHCCREGAAKLDGL